jgi:acetylornithine deacetylase/succinyl-diaminopimelate desuccinylase-like protein
MDAWKTYLEENKDRFLEELFELLRIPSVSTDPDYSDDIFDAAEFVRSKLEEAGADHAKAIPTDGYPVVYGEKIIDTNKPTVLVYGHYDVQPPDPYDLWKTEPFDPFVEDGNIVARGASDDKGQMFTHIKAFETMMQTDTLPCNIKFMIEGEEECGSSSLKGFVHDNRDQLDADVVLISDTAMISNETPSITVGLRGISYLEVEVTGPNRDLHSGIYGGAVGNPINILCNMIAQLKDDKNCITIPGFYDDVEEVPREERDEMARVPFDLSQYKQDLGIADVEGEEGYTTLERTSIRPSLDANGIWGGYIKEGAKTVLPSKANAKISMRLVPNQHSEKITQQFVDYFKSLAPASVEVSFNIHHGANPIITPTDSKAYQAASQALATTYGTKPLPLRTGGSIPIVGMFEQELGLKSILLGFGLDSDAIHSPNEKFGLFNFYKAIETIPHFHKNLADDI